MRRGGRESGDIIAEAEENWAIVVDLFSWAPAWFGYYYYYLLGGIE